MENNNIIQATASKSKEKNSPINKKLSIVPSMQCRICYDDEKTEDLIAPCHCKGTVAFVHRSCLESWLGESGTTTCELCHHLFKTERTPKYSSTNSIWQWFRHGPRYSGAGVRGDLLACTIVTPLAIVVTYICLYSSEYYSQQKFSQIPAARWTSISLLLMIGIMLFGYYLWVNSVIRMHARMWYNWWQRTCIVRYIPPSTITLNERNEEECVVAPNNTPNIRNNNELDDSNNTNNSIIEETCNFDSAAIIEIINAKSQGDKINVGNHDEDIIIINIEDDDEENNNDSEKLET